MRKEIYSYNGTYKGSILASLFESPKFVKGLGLERVISTTRSPDPIIMAHIEVYHSNRYGVTIEHNFTSRHGELLKWAKGELSSSETLTLIGSEPRIKAAEGEIGRIALDSRLAIELSPLLVTQESA